MDNYFVISCSEDGDTSLKRYTKDELETALADEDWGPNVNFLKTASAQVNLQEVGPGIYIIKGTAVIPTEKAVVTAWTV